MKYIIQVYKVEVTGHGEGDTQTHSWNQERSEREEMVWEGVTRVFLDFFSEDWKLRCRVGIQVWVRYNEIFNWLSQTLL